MSISSTDSGAPIYLKDNAWASKFFSLTGGQNPKNKFSYICALVPKNIVTSSTMALKDIKNYIHLVKTVEPPKPNFDVEVVDQYNKRRIIQKKITWDPVTITFHDDRNSLIYSMLIEYMSYYYKDFRNTEAIDWTLDTVSNLINETDWGYQAQIEKYFFHCICLAWTHGGKGTQIRLTNPMITNIQFDQLDYSDGTTPLEISVTFEYEGVRLSSINALLNETLQLNLTKAILDEVNEIGQPFDDARFQPGASMPGDDRSLGLGEIFAAGATFYGKHNGKPTVKNLVDDFVLRPIKGVASSSINSWGNFNFGGIGTAKKVGGLLGGSGNVIGNQVGDVFKVANSGTIIQDVFSFGKNGASGG